jgi:hypothetical protein
LSDIRVRKTRAGHNHRTTRQDCARADRLIFVLVMF